MKTVARSLTVLALFYTLVVCLIWSLTGNIDRDENQFMASAFMIAENGLHPYRDFAYFHMPNLAYIYAPFFKTDDPLLFARIFTALSAFGICLTVFWHGHFMLRSQHWLVRLFVPVCMMLLLVHSHMFKHAASHVWNHTSSVSLGLIAFVLMLRWRKNPYSSFLVGTSGFALGMAIGIRLSLAPLVIPFVFAILAHHDLANEHKTKNFLIFCFTGLIANLPTLYFLVLNFNEFVFGNLVYPGFNTEYYRDIGFQRAMDLQGKSDYFWFRIMDRPSHQIIAFTGVVGVLIYLVSFIFRRTIVRSDLLFIAVTFVFLVIGCIAPTPSQKQYYFILFPFFMILVIHLLSSVEGKVLPSVMVTILSAILVASFLIYSPYSFRGKLARALANEENLTISVLARESREINKLVTGKREGATVLTLSPVFVVNDKTPIFPEFTTGPFAYNYSYLIPEDQARRQRIPHQSNLENFFLTNIPAAVLTGHEKETIEESIVDIAKSLNYSEIQMPSGNVLWLSPE